MPSIEPSQHRMCRGVASKMRACKGRERKICNSPWVDGNHRSAVSSAAVVLVDDLGGVSCVLMEEVMPSAAFFEG